MRIRVLEIESADEEDVLSRGTPGTSDTRLIWWGSECLGCGNTTPDSMRCDECNHVDTTRALWMEQP